MRLGTTGIVASAALGLAAFATAGTLAQNVPPGAPLAILASEALVPEMQATIMVMAPDLMGDNQQIDTPFLATAQGGQNISPEINWTAGPEGTQSYVVIVQDKVNETLVVRHWIVYNIPANVMSLPEGVPAGASIDGISGAVQFARGNNADTPNMAYGGPNPPAGPAHNYSFQVFALDVAKIDEGETTTGPSGARYEELLADMQGHVLAWGLLTAQYGRPAETPPSP